MATDCSDSVQMRSVACHLFLEVISISLTCSSAIILQMAPLLKGDFQANSAYIIKVFLDLVDIDDFGVYVYQFMKIGALGVSIIHAEIFLFILY